MELEEPVISTFFPRYFTATQNLNSSPLSSLQLFKGKKKEYAQLLVYRLCCLECVLPTWPVQVFYYTSLDRDKETPEETLDSRGDNIVEYSGLIIVVVCSPIKNM